MSKMNNTAGALFKCYKTCNLNDYEYITFLLSPAANSITGSVSFTLPVVS